MKQNLYVLASLAVALLVVVQFARADWFIRNEKQAFDKISKHLEKTVPKRHPELDIREIELMLAKRSDKTKPDTKRSPLTKALTFLSALESLSENPKCNLEDLEILKLNSDANHNQVEHEPEDLSRDARITSVLRHYFVKHAKNCLPIYPDLFAARLRRLDPEMLGRAKQVISDEYINTASLHQPDQLYELIRDDNLNMRIKVGDKDLEEHYYDALLSIVPEDDLSKRVLSPLTSEPDEEVRKLHFNVAKLRLLYDKYIIGSCKYYVEELKDVFEVALLDLKVYLDPDESRDDLSEYQKGLARYVMCKIDDTASWFASHADLDFESLKNFVILKHGLNPKDFKPRREGGH